MSSLRDLDVLIIDCQAGGATPAYGDLLELGWAVCSRVETLGPIHQHWIVPRTARRVPGAIRDLTGWNESCVAAALPENEAWAALHQDIARVREPPAPALIHYARFELPFLHDLHERLGGTPEFPLDTLCLHAIGARLFPDLPRRNIRALAGFLGHTPELIRRCAGHVEASAAIWRGVVPLLEQQGVHSWTELAAWIADAPRSTRRDRRRYPFDAERRRALPDRPGVYRFLRSNGDVMYVGKAASLRKRVAGHFKSRGDVTERALELLSQVHDIRITQTPSVLEAALLEAYEIKRIDPPYNVQLRSGERRAWFASRDLSGAAPAPDDAHRIGPLPSERALSSLYALIKLAAGAEPTPLLRAIALAVPGAFLPEDALFLEGWQAFAAEHLQRPERDPARRVDQAARALWLARGRKELESTTPDAPPHFWDLTRVRRRLERGLVQPGLLMRRARWLVLLSCADVVYRERGMQGARGLIVESGEIREALDLEHVDAVRRLPVRPVPALRARQAIFDAGVYDRLRVLATELARVRDEQGEMAVRVGPHVYGGERLSRLMAAV
ncbi:MAG TPA: GIY-YIG nuclease family protein [Polyangiales bacterium]|nr:GIY-YIG nuclease family protein [Polyangiales bacterium]